jgi:hypothetical protein
MPNFKIKTRLELKKFHLILVLHRPIMFNSGSNCEMDMVANFAKRRQKGGPAGRPTNFFGPVRDTNKTEVNRDGRFESIS